MIFFTDNDGTIIKSLPSPVYQGSANTNNVYLVAPFAANAQVTVAFQLPNGTWTTPAMMTQESALNGIVDAQGRTYAGWSYSIPNSVTQYYGVVTVQFFFYGTNSGVVTASSSTTITVGKGVPIVLPDTPTDEIYEQILNALSQITTELSSGVYVSRSVFPWQSTTTYNTNEITFYPVGQYGAFVKSTQENNTNNAPYNSESVLNSSWWEEVANFNQIQELQAQADAFDQAIQEAQTAAENAQASANASAESASQSSDSAENALSSANSAQQSAENSANSALQAEAYAEQAKQYAQNSYVIYPSFSDLPNPGDSAFIYLVPISTTTPNDGYNEYLWITNTSSYELIGSVNDIDLSGYAQTTGTYPNLTAGAAEKLSTARSVQVNLASDQSANFDGSQNVTPGVTGVLPVENGGTGTTSLSNVTVGNATNATNDGNGNNIAATYAKGTLVPVQYNSNQWQTFGGQTAKAGDIAIIIKNTGSPSYLLGAMYEISSASGTTVTLSTINLGYFVSGKAIQDGSGTNIENQFTSIATFASDWYKFYVSPTSENPASFFGGTWEQIEGQFILGAGSSYAALSTGGNENVTLQYSNMPQHNHEVIGQLLTTTPGAGLTFRELGNASTQNTNPGLTGYAGNTTPFSIMPPYISLYMWYKISD